MTNQINATTPRPANTPIYRTWRAVNTAVLVLAFFAPWFNGCRDIKTDGNSITAYSGFQLLPFMVLGLFSGIAIFLTLGTAGVLIYSALSIILVVVPSHSRLYAWAWRWAKLCLAVSLASLCIEIILVLNYNAPHPSDFTVNGMARLAWGYWLTLIGLTSGATLEVTRHLTERSHPPPNNF